MIERHFSAAEAKEMGLTDRTQIETERETYYRERAVQSRADSDAIESATRSLLAVLEDYRRREVKWDSVSQAIVVVNRTLRVVAGEEDP